MIVCAIIGVPHKIKNVLKYRVDLHKFGLFQRKEDGLWITVVLIIKQNLAKRCIESW